MEIESRTYRSHVHSVMCKAVAVHMEHVRVVAKGTDVPDGRVIHAHFKWRIIRIDQPVQRRKGRRLSGVELAGRSEVDELGMPGRIPFGGQADLFSAPGLTAYSLVKP
jgi:hypothetical protein